MLVAILIDLYENVVYKKAYVHVWNSFSRGNYLLEVKVLPVNQEKDIHVIVNYKCCN